MNYYLFPFNLIKKNSRIVLYGAGAVMRDFVDQLQTTQYCKILFAVDRNYKNKTPYNRVKVVSPSKVLTANYDNIIIAVSKKFSDGVMNDLEKLGVSVDKVINTNVLPIKDTTNNNDAEKKLGIYHNRLKQLNDMFERNVEESWAPDSVRRKWVCRRPFQKIFIHGDGAVYTCCSNYLKQGYSIGNIFSSSLDKIWNSDIAKRLRYSVTEGAFEYCNVAYCNELRAPDKYPDTMFPRQETGKYIKWQDCSIEETPKHITLAIDSSCNLYCASCRDSKYVCTNDQSDKVTEILENFVRPALDNCETLVADGGGEFLISKPYKRFYKSLTNKEYPNLKLGFYTNGMLFSSRFWEEYSNLKGMVSSIMVSIDAATKKTYEKLRRGGCWEILCENMEFLSSMKTAGEIKRFTMSFVVQKENFREMREFVKLAEKWNADSVNFRRLYCKGTYSPESFTSNDVFSVENPDYKEAQRILTGLLDSLIVEVRENCLIYTPRKVQYGR